MPDLKFKIIATVDSTGVQGLQTALGRVAAAGKTLEADSASLSSEMRQQVEVSKALSSVSNVQETSIRRLATGMKQLGHEIPIVGVAMRALLNPWTALAAIAGIFIVKIKEAIAVQTQLAKESAELSLRLDPLIIKQVRTAQLQGEAAEAAREHNRALAEQNSVLEANAIAADKAADARQRAHDNAAKILAAEKELALAKAGDDPLARARVEAEFRAREEQARQLAAASAIEGAHRKLRDTRAAATEAGAALPGARAAATAAAERAKAEIDQINEQIKIAAAEEKAMEQEGLAGERGEEIRGRAPFPGFPGITQVTAGERARRGKAGMVAARTRIDELTARRNAIEAASKIPAERVSALQAQQRTAEAALPGLQAIFDKIVGDETARRQAAQIVNALRTQAEELTAQAAAQEENTRLQKQMAEELKRQNREIRQILASGANKMQ